ncbi:MAG: type II toxin-antitoxin system RelE/ParE family toxin [Dyadobacter sp.]|uniref:type II toxin-antitoxin system RelE/ParE family toxin n=1 Tax=Dyadobacter sp. TaxID=1914288 RepID=UPI0032665A7F
MPDSKTLQWTERAILDYEVLTEYLFYKWGEKIALRVLSVIDFQIDRIKNHPLQFPIFIRQNEIRRCVASAQTSIFFVENAETITLLSIFDNRLDPLKYPQ